MALSVNRLGDVAGAEILGMDCRAPLGETTLGTIYQAFLDHHVVCIRDQDIDMHRFMEVAACFGELQVQIIKHYAHPETDLISVISPAVNRDRVGNGAKPIVRGQYWHTDHSYTAVPCKATMLHALKVPSTGGDTRFLNLHLVYETLPEKLKQRIEGLRGVHELDARRAVQGRIHSQAERAGSKPYDHPLVRRHDETGRKSLYINPNRMNGIEGWNEEDSDTLLDALNAHAFQERFEYRHKWRPHDILIWDNRCLLHAATDDFDEPRLLHRILLKGTVPVGPKASQHAN